MSSRWWSTARSIRSLTRRLSRDFYFFFKRRPMLRNGSNMIFLRIHRDPPWPLSVKPHTTGLNFSSILTKQCISFNPTHWYLNIPLDQTHPFLKGFYFSSVTLSFTHASKYKWPCTIYMGESYKTVPFNINTPTLFDFFLSYSVLTILGNQSIENVVARRCSIHQWS